MESKYSYLISYGEVALKGKNRDYFISRLVKNIRQAFKNKGATFELKKLYGKFMLRVSEGMTERDIEGTLKEVFGIATFCHVEELPLQEEGLSEAVVACVQKAMDENPLLQTFRITAKRSNRMFSKSGNDLNCELGGAVLEVFPQLKAKMKNPDLNVQLEVREQGIYLYSVKRRGAGGLPVGTSGRGLLMLSGGIDSPVAGWQILKRGMSLLPLHFESPPYTSERAKKKVMDLAKVLRRWGCDSRLGVVNFTDIQVQINEKAERSYGTLLIRKAMMDICEAFLKNSGHQAIVTGENLGQVASQTVESMTVTGYGLGVPVFRPLIGLDKQEIMGQAQEIDTYDISNRPYEDCCTVFLPENPKTKPKLENFQKEFEKADLGELIQKAVESIEFVEI